MTNSMTGFAASKGEIDGWSWAWDIRAVNARGLDIRLRVPDWIEGLEQGLRSTIQKAVARGNVSLSLKVQRVASEADLHLDEAALDRTLIILKKIEVEARGSHNMDLSPTNAATVMGMPGILTTSDKDQDTSALKAALLSDLDGLLSEFNAMRAREGQALAAIIAGQLEQIETLTEAAKPLAEARRADMAKTLQDNLARVLDNTSAADPDRVAQELALIAVKTDVTEEIDRLHAHVSAATDLLEANTPVGRKLDFLTQEFNREANTLCSKAQSRELTNIGLELKAVIDQMREQVQNME